MTRDRRVGRAWPALDDERDETLAWMMSVPRAEASSRHEEERVRGASEGID